MRKKQIKSPKRGSIFLKTIIVLVVLACAGFFYIHHQLSPVNAQDQEIQLIEIPQGSTRDDIAKILEEKNIIRSAPIFTYYVRFSADASKFHAGFYEFSSAMSVSEIVNQLELGKTQDHVVQLIVREGIDIEDIADLVDQETDFTKKEFLEKVQDPLVIQHLVKKYPALLTEASEKENTRYTLEGYLFPKTYPVTKEMRIEDLLDEMVNQSHLILEKYSDQFENSKLSIHEIFTLASIVEREGTDEKDRALISGVFYNRLSENMPLQTDISIIYALGTHKEYITLEDIEIDSPYNTYLYPGLMPGPVNSPGEAAIVATLNPEITEYLYFLADVKTGEVYFSKTYEEHLEYQEQYVPSEAPENSDQN